jgi:hypothetical protein
MDITVVPFPLGTPQFRGLFAFFYTGLSWFDWNDWNDRTERKTEFIGTTGKPDHRKAGITGKLELPDSWNDWKANRTGMLELPES